jgi:hypothetical protein
MLAEVNFSAYISCAPSRQAHQDQCQHIAWNEHYLENLNSNDERNTSKIRKKAAKIKKIELVRFLATAPKTESTQQKEIRFDELLDKCFVGQDSKKRNNLLMIPKLAEIAAPLYALTG